MPHYPMKLFNIFKKRPSEKEQRLINMFEDGKILHIDDNVDNVKVMKPTVKVQEVEEPEEAGTEIIEDIEEVESEFKQLKDYRKEDGESGC